MSDLFFNQIGSVLVVAPTPTGQLKELAQKKIVAFYEEAEQEPALTRWIFADFPEETLIDQWGNRYDHQVHSLLAGNLDDGRRFLELLAESGFISEEASGFFVPFQKLDISSEDSSDNLRHHHPRAFTLAKRGRKSVAAMVTDVRDFLVLGAKSQ